MNQLLEVHSFFLYYFILEDMHTRALQFVRLMIVLGRTLWGIISVVCRLWWITLVQTSWAISLKQKPDPRWCICLSVHSCKYFFKAEIKAYCWIIHLGWRASISVIADHSIFFTPFISHFFSLNLSCYHNYLEEGLLPCHTPHRIVTSVIRVYRNRLSFMTCYGTEQPPLGGEGFPIIPMDF